LCCQVGIEELFGTSLNIFPNPFNEYLMVEFDLNQTSNLNIYLTDVLGRKTNLDNYDTFNGQFQKSFDLSNFSSGVYFLEIQIGENKQVKKVIKR